MLPKYQLRGQLERVAFGITEMTFQNMHDGHLFQLSADLLFLEHASVTEFELRAVQVWYRLIDEHPADVNSPIRVLLRWKLQVRNSYGCCA